MITGYVMFRLGERAFATSLDDVREIVRLAGLERLPGVQAPLAGVIELRGAPLPVLDVRGPDAPEDQGDVLVLEVDGDAVGVAVDQVLAVLPAEALPELTDRPAKVLPSYVIGVRSATDGPVLLVDLEKMLDVAASGWAESLANVDDLASL
ncbi:MAG TPA: chemotaxis protein CheW [Mycobacteriales bacterium]|jgi:two-component system chemotaxis response regulator CheV|nr:chemotaxis protein CheW [Mycobacteriales bacterium]